ncbi:amidase family protein [Alicyclobacillus fastidiosus]|uniref:amidase family protein n=1 Tax=Alicyclobacillus fastidiosus TaxID=392011 RepID=UPI0034DCF697
MYIPGKVTLYKFAAGATNINVHYGNARNPWNPDCITGGSSGGSGNAVGGGTAIASLGTDTAGSVRIPSAMCGIYGLKTTYGRVSKHGVHTWC